MNTPWLLLLLSCSTSSPPPAPPLDDPAPPATEVLPLPSDSLYHLEIDGVTHTGSAVNLDLYRGHPVVVSMFYSYCPSACPMLISELKAVESALDPQERAQLRVLLVSLDPKRDTPAQLASAMRDHDVDADRWTMLSTSPSDVREVAAALGIRYRPTADGEMNHSSILTLLDSNGVPVARHEGLGSDHAPFEHALRTTLGRSK
jgi:protein SCO1/2